MINILRVIKLFSFSACALMLYGCSCCCMDGEGDWVKKIDSEEATYVIQRVMPYLRHAKHLRLENAAIYYNDTIHTVRLEFISQDVLEVKEARFLIVDTVEGLLTELNRNPILAPELLTYPLTADRLEIYIDFESFHGNYVDPYYVGYTQLEDGIVSFYAFDTKYPRVTLWDCRTEPYEKSREIAIYEREYEKLFKQVVELQNPKILPEQYISPEKNIPRYYNPYDPNYIFE